MKLDKSQYFKICALLEDGKISRKAAMQRFHLPKSTLDYWIRKYRKEYGVIDTDIKGRISRIEGVISDMLVYNKKVKKIIFKLMGIDDDTAEKK